MRLLDPATLPSSSTCTIVARSSAVAPEFLVAGTRRDGLLAARWRRTRVCQEAAQPLPDHVLSYCATGTVSCAAEIGGVRMHAMQHAGSMSLVPAGAPARWQLKSTAAMVHMHVYIGAAAVAEFAQRHLGGGEPPRLRSSLDLRDPWLDGYFRMLMCECDLHAPRRRLDESTFLDDTANLLIAHLLHAHAHPAHDGDAPAGGHGRISPLRPTLVQRVEAFVQDHLADDIRLDTLAALASLSVDHFVRSFREAVGMTPHRYLLAQRLNRASELLRDSDDPIAAIAKRCGFASAAHFSVVFHRFCGVAPSRFRRGR